MLVISINKCGGCIYLLKCSLYLNLEAFESHKYITLLFIKGKYNIIVFFSYLPHVWGHCGPVWVKNVHYALQLLSSEKTYAPYLCRLYILISVDPSPMFLPVPAPIMIISWDRCIGPCLLSNIGVLVVSDHL